MPLDLKNFFVVLNREVVTNGYHDIIDVTLKCTW